MKLLKSLTLAAGLLIAGAAMNAAAAAVVTSNVNIRSGPGTGYRVIGSLPAGARVNVGRCSGNWCRVAGGWVSAGFLSGGGTSVVVNPNYYANDVALGVGAFALGAAVGSTWGPGWGGGGWYGPGWGGGWYGPGWRPRPVWGPGWRGPGWRGGRAWRGGPGWRGGRAWRGGPGFRGRPVYFRPGFRRR
ncbi:SH3 domain-containing protein [Ancylobacter sp. TS-1]|uniref:SH3 domain-containing protein n=1 Tax=Ancylobacter sp. TS-1 TaxID=1850374 RepID=UPI00192E3AE9|nr:SH3 domain-containing protein [Ancylobacter sp. TS-1]